MFCKPQLCLIVCITVYDISVTEAGREKHLSTKKGLIAQAANSVFSGVIYASFSLFGTVGSLDLPRHRLVTDSVDAIYRPDVRTQSGRGEGPLWELFVGFHLTSDLV